MPAVEALAEAGRRRGASVEAVEIASNELLEKRLTDDAPFDLIFPSDYMIERLRAQGRIVALDREALPLENLTGWAAEAPYDPGNRHSVPFAFGTTGILHDEHLGATSSWEDLFQPRAGLRVGMLAEVREVVGAALLAVGHSPNATDERALGAARELLERQRPVVARYDSDDFVSPVADGTLAAHHAWSGPAALAAHANRRLRYVVPREGALLWVTAAAIPCDAPNPERALSLLRELMDPQLAALTTSRNGYATPNEPARRLLAEGLRDDPALFPPAEVLARTHMARDLGPREARMEAVWQAVVCAAA